MKLKNELIAALFIMMGCLAYFLGSNSSKEEHKCENEWWMRFGKIHLEKCDTLHEKCFKLKED